MPKDKDFQVRISHFGDFLAGYASSFDYLSGGGRNSYPKLSGGFQREAEIVRKGWESAGSSLYSAIESYSGAHK